jgi:hypothetical protein
MNLRNIAVGLAALAVLLACGTAGEDRPLPDPPSLSSPARTGAAGTPSPSGPVAGTCDALKNLQISSVQYPPEEEWPDAEMTLTDGRYDSGSRHIELTGTCAFGDISGDGVSDAVGVINYIDYDYLAIAWKGTSSGYRLHGSLHLYNAAPRSLSISGDHATVALGGTVLTGYPDTIQFRISNSDAVGVDGIACLGAWAAACPTFTG